MCDTEGMPEDDVAVVDLCVGWVGGDPSWEAL